MSHADAPPQIAVFGPDPLLTVTVEPRNGTDEVHVHAGGQGVWVARMAAELGVRPSLCSLIGGETGEVLRGLLGAIGGEHRLIATAGPTGTYVIDHRHGERRLVASALRPAPARHELDDLVAATCATALDSALLVIANPFPADDFPLEAYELIAADARAGGVPFIVDLSSPRLERVLASAPALVKLNDWELAEFVRGPVDGPRALAAAERLIALGAGAVAVTRAGGPILVVPAGAPPYEIVPPAFPHGHREGCGDTMTGAVAAALALGRPLREALVLGAAAGSGNFLRRGLGTGHRDVVEQLARHVTVRPLADTAAPARSPLSAAGQRAG